MNKKILTFEKIGFLARRPPWSNLKARDANLIRTLGDYSKPSHEGYRNTIELHIGNNVVPLRSVTIRFVQNGCSFHGLWSEDPNEHLKDFLKLMDSLDLDAKNRERTKNRKTPQRYLDVPTKSRRISLRSMDSFQGLTTKSPSSWHRPLSPSNDPRDFAKPVKAISLPQDIPCTSDRRLIELENQVQRLMKVYLSLTQPTQVNKITTSCKICNSPHDTQYCMEDPEQAFIEYASLRTDEVGGLVSIFMASQDARLSKFEADFKQQQSKMTNKIDTVLKAITDRTAGSLPSDMVKNSKLSAFLVLSACSYPTEYPQCSAHIHGSISTITIHPKQQSDPYNDEPTESEEEEKDSLKNTNTNPSASLDPSVESA
uniref:MAK10-like protein n=1 Tax=Tanacetum cinerariifolium TaxID=118510 RepID=A0A699GQA7_TANCI|nr:MAK10-like protein [Tanacetum cinerariifolium]